MPTVGVLGAGTMGAGIAQVAAAAGWTVRLLDADPAIVARKIEEVGRNFARLVEKGRMTAAEAEAARGRLVPVDAAAEFADAELVIEAIVEDLDAKVAALRPVAAAAPTAILASNTSSLSIGRLGAALSAAPRTVGMHFFNPVPLMPLVEVISGPQTAEEHADRTAEIAKAWGKSVVRASDTPGFIVNRVARGYYLEALRMFDEGIAGVDEIDATLKRLGGFRMGPFELMDLIGIDVNYSVSLSVWEQMGRPARLSPHRLQRELVDRGHLGRKTRRGVYSYDREPPTPALAVERRSYSWPDELRDAVRRFADGAARGAASVTEQYILARPLAAIINEAALALDENVASADDIDTAMRLGTNYPLGPLQWADQIGRHTCATLLRRLNATVDDGRFTPARSLA